MITKLLLFIVHDPFRKIIALIFSFGLWLFVAIDFNYVYQRVLPVTYTDLPDSLIITDSLAELPVEFQGQGKALIMIWLTRPQVFCRLANARKGDNEIAVKELFIPLTYPDVLINYPQQTIIINTDEKISKSVRLNVPLRGQIRAGYAVLAVRAPETLTICGPRSLLRNLTVVSTDSVSVNDKNASFIQPLTLQFETPLIKAGRSLAPAQIEVDTADQKLLTNLPLKIQNPFGYRLTIDHALIDSLMIEGPRTLIKTITNHDVEISIRLANLKPGYYSLPAEIRLPQYIKPISSAPKRFGIRIY